MDAIENPGSDRWKQFLQAWNEDIYLQLSVYGMVVFVVLCVFIVLCWSHYGAAVSSVVDPKSGWSLLSDACFSLIYNYCHRRKNSYFAKSALTRW